MMKIMEHFHSEVEDVTADWYFEKLPALILQMRTLGFVSPLMWITKQTCEDICRHKLIDLMNFSPSDWDCLVGSLVVITRGVLLGRVSYANAHISIKRCQNFLETSQCPLLTSCREAMRHLVETTRVMVTCLHFQDAHICAGTFTVKNVSTLANEDCSAIVAARSICLQICHYALWPSLMDERGPLFGEAVRAAGCALSLNSLEGYWLTLYARCLPLNHPEKRILLEAGCRLRPLPFTFIEYAIFLSQLNESHAAKVAADFCQMCVERWPNLVFVNSAYVSIFLSSKSRAWMRFETALDCVRRGRQQAPDSPMLAWRLSSLRDVRRANGRLTPILEEENDSLNYVWSSQKELSLIQIAKRLYPSPVSQGEFISGTFSSPRAPASHCAAAHHAQAEQREESAVPNDLWVPENCAQNQRRTMHVKLPQRYSNRDSTTTNPVDSNPILAAPMKTPNGSSLARRVRQMRLIGPLRRPRTSTESAGLASSDSKDTTAQASNQSKLSSSMAPRSEEPSAVPCPTSKISPGEVFKKPSVVACTSSGMSTAEPRNTLTPSAEPCEEPSTVPFTISKISTAEPRKDSGPVPSTSSTMSTAEIPEEPNTAPCNSSWMPSTKIREELSTVLCPTSEISPSELDKKLSVVPSTSSKMSTAEPRGEPNTVPSTFSRIPSPEPREKFTAEPRKNSGTVPHTAFAMSTAKPRTVSCPTSRIFSADPRKEPITVPCTSSRMSFAEPPIVPCSSSRIPVAEPCEEPNTVACSPDGPPVARRVRFPCLIGPLRRPRTSFESVGLPSSDSEDTTARAPVQRKQTSSMAPRSEKPSAVPCPTPKISPDKLYNESGTVLCTPSNISLAENPTKPTDVLLFKKMPLEVPARETSGLALFQNSPTDLFPSPPLTPSPSRVHEKLRKSVGTFVAKDLCTPPEEDKRSPSPASDSPQRPTLKENKEDLDENNLRAGMIQLRSKFQTIGVKAKRELKLETSSSKTAGSLSSETQNTLCSEGATLAVSLDPNRDTHVHGNVAGAPPAAPCSGSQRDGSDDRLSLRPETHPWTRWVAPVQPKHKCDVKVQQVPLWRRRPGSILDEGCSFGRGRSWGRGTDETHMGNKSAAPAAPGILCSLAKPATADFLPAAAPAPFESEPKRPL